MVILLLNSSLGNSECGGCCDEKTVGIKGGNKGIKETEISRIESYRI
jgi:hypothetical protein